MIVSPPNPTRCSASKSAVMPCFVIFPLTQNPYTQGRALSGGCLKPSSNGSPPKQRTATNSTAKITRNPALVLNRQNARRVERQSPPQIGQLFRRCLPPS